MSSEDVRIEKDRKPASSLAARLRGFFSSDPQVEEETAQINLKRITFSSLIALPVHLSHILTFILKQPGPDTVVATWRAGIIAPHSAMFVIMASFAIIGSRSENREGSTHPSKPSST